MGDHHYLQPQNLMYNGYLQLSQSGAQQSAADTSMVQMRTLREQLNQCQSERDQLQKELNHERQQKIQLQQEFQKAVQAQQELNYQCMTLRLEVAKYQQHQHFQSLQHQQQAEQLRQIHPTQQMGAQSTVKSEDVKPDVNHICDECQFETKSQVSLFIHKLNHNLGAQTPRHLHLPTRVFTTKGDPNVQFSYKCPSCDESSSFARHEIYPHVYQFHSSEQPHKCPICLLYFTHTDYLTEHKLDKHKMGIAESPGLSSGRGRGRGGRPPNQSRMNNKNGAKGRTPPPKGSVIQTPFGAVKQEPMTQPLALTTSGSCGQSPTRASSVESMTAKRKLEDSPEVICVSEPTPPMKMQVKTPTTTITLAKDDDELSCTYPGCGFTAPSRDRLQFHMSAHTMSKYKCPYCAYVGNILIDIRRHILKSKKHEGLNVFQCQKCDYGSDCERTFKDHLKKFHFGLDVDESALDSVLEELFLNENNKQSASID